jgi:peptidoglycan L-alanyl-D-glutamate endopeptidase CwlK
MRLRAKQAKFWLKVAQVMLKAAEWRTPIVILDWDRTAEEQMRLVERGASKTLNSKHISGLAVDFAFLDDIEDDGTINWDNEKYRPLGEYAESIGLTWGGRFGDKPETTKIEGWDCGHLEMG